MSSFVELFDRVKETCGWESISPELNKELGRACGLEEVGLLIRYLEELDDEDLEDDVGDLGDYYWRLRTSISDALVAAGDASIPLLLNALDSENAEASGYAARSLGKLKAREAICPITRFIQDSDHDSGKLLYVAALGEIGAEQSIDVLAPLIRTCGGERKGSLARCAAIALGEIGSESCVALLGDALKNDDDWFARLGAAEGLGKLKFASSISVLEFGLQDTDSRVAKAARESLERVKTALDCE